MLARIVKGYRSHPAAMKAIDLLIAVSAGIILEAVFGVTESAESGTTAVASALGL